MQNSAHKGQFSMSDKKYGIPWYFAVADLPKVQTTILARMVLYKTELLQTPWKATKIKTQNTTKTKHCSPPLMKYKKAPYGHFFTHILLLYLFQLSYIIFIIIVIILVIILIITLLLIFGHPKGRPLFLSLSVG